MDLQLNFSDSNETSTLASVPIYDLAPWLVIFSSLGITIGTLFSILCIFRYVKEPGLRTHYNYIFYFMLIYCFLSSLINTPIFLIGYYMHKFEDSYWLCQISIVHYLTINIGLISSLAYASVERHYLIFRPNGQLTWQRQLFPSICLLVYSYVIAFLFTILPSCPYVACVSCQSSSISYMLPWLILSFCLPLLIMIASTIHLLQRLRRHRAASNRRLEWTRSRKIVLQMSVYIIWACLYYCPVTFYNLAILFDSKYFSAMMKSTMNIINTVCVQSYAILTYASIYLISKKQRHVGRVKKESQLKLNHLSTITASQQENM